MYTYIYIYIYIYMGIVRHVAVNTHHLRNNTHHLTSAPPSTVRVQRLYAPYIIIMSLSATRPAFLGLFCKRELRI